MVSKRWRSEFRKKGFDMTSKKMRVLTKQSLVILRGIAAAEPKSLWEEPLDALVSEHKLETVEVQVEFQRGHDFIVGKPRDGQFDLRNALNLRKALPELTASQATDERIWATLALGEYKDYVMTRWAASGSLTDAVRNKIFASGTRSLVREHSLARLWWRVHFASFVDPKHSKNPLEVIFSHEDIAGEIAGRAILTDPKVLSAYVGIIENGLVQLEEQPKSTRLSSKLFIQRTGKKLNMLAGRFMLGSVTPERLRALMEDAHVRVMADRAQELEAM
jgi:hypothetical protein